MQDRNAINGMAAATFIMIEEMYKGLAPFILLGVVLIAVDCRFGIAAAKVRGEEIRLSRLIRRSINKLVDYICWVVLAGLFGLEFGTLLGIPVLSALLLLIIYGIELTSVFDNYFKARDINKRVNIFKLIRPDVDSVIEDIKAGKEESENPSINGQK